MITYDFYCMEWGYFWAHRNNIVLGGSFADRQPVRSD